MKLTMDEHGRTEVIPPPGVRVRPAHETSFNRGLTRQREGRESEALAAYREALEHRPHFPEAFNNMGQIHLKRGEWAPALECFRRAVRLSPGFPEPRFNLGELFRLMGQSREAEESYRLALSLNPRMMEAWNNLGHLLLRHKDPEGAATCFRRAVRLKPDLPEVRYNLGRALREAGALDAAAREFMAALKLRPGYAEVHNSLGLVWKSLGRNDLAEGAFSCAVRTNPELAEARWNRSLLLLQQGNFAEGWQDYEWRFRIPQRKLIYPRRVDLPRWEGEPAEARSLLVHDEQGLGDTLQFVRYLPGVRERLGRVILETRRELKSLLEGFPGVDEIVVRPDGDDPPARADLCVPLLSLPRIFKTTLETIPAAVPYLHAEPDKARVWARHRSGPEIHIGLVWAGRPEHANDRNRSCPLALFEPLLDIPGLRWFSLQKGPAAAQAEAPPFSGLLTDWGSRLSDFSDSAAAVANLDLVLSVDTAVVHLAGAMGRPAWALISFVSDWRWMQDREDSPWYPSLRLFRQKKPGDWGEVLQRVADALRALAAKIETPPTGAFMNPRADR